MSKFSVGQRWSYQTRTQDRHSTLVIGKVQKRFLRSSIYHIQVQGLVSPHVTVPAVIGHMPISEKALAGSVTELQASGVQLDEVFDEGFAIWQSHRGGVFDIAVRDAVEAIFSAAPKPQASPPEDSFDELVKEMRAQRSRELIDVLYQRVIALPEWFFLCDPNDERTPVEWVFPDGHNKTPAVLAFTSRERAAKAAKAIGIYPSGASIAVMSPTVSECVEWIAGPRFANSWLCFNHTQESFPFYVEDIVKWYKNK